MGACRQVEHEARTGSWGRRVRVRGGLTALAALLLLPNVAQAQRIENGVAVFAALDKVTARISKLPIKLGETVRFGALKITPRACYTRQPTEPPKTSTFVEVDEIQLDGSVNRIFSGWMFAESPGLNAVEHPVFDVWLTECSEPARAVAGPKGAPGPAAKGLPARQVPAAPGQQPVAREPAPVAAQPELPEEPIRRPRPRR